MNIRNVEFDFDILRAADADRFQQAVNEMQAAAAAVPKAGGLGAIIRANCAAIDNFLADLLGEDYDQRLGIDTDNLRQLQAVYYEMLDACTAVQKEIQSMGAVTTAAGVDVKARAAAAAKQAAQCLPTPAIGHFVLGDPTEAADLAVAEAKPAGAVADVQPVGAIGEASRPFPASPTAPSVQPDFAHMNRAQRRAWVKALAGRK